MSRPSLYQSPKPTHPHSAFRMFMFTRERSALRLLTFNFYLLTSNS
jgi:hypothetical protein